MSATSTIILEKAAMKNNWQFLRKYFGKDLKISVASFGEMINQLNYELLTRLPRDIPRLVN